MDYSENKLVKLEVYITINYNNFKCKLILSL